MDVKRAMEIYSSQNTYHVQLEDDSVWIENVDEANGMATVMVNNKPTDTRTVSCDRLKEIESR